MGLVGECNCSSSNSSSSSPDPARKATSRAVGAPKIYKCPAMATAAQRWPVGCQI
jgi:hypothetical protein